MAISLNLHTEDVVSLGDYIAYLDDHVDVHDIESLEASAGKFRSLLNDRRLITKALNDQLIDWRTFQSGNTYSAQTFILGGGCGYFIRANIWAPPSRDGDIRAAEDQISAFQLVHDHNFTFMTGGYFGPGYRTCIYEYDRKGLAGIAGERARLEFLEDTSLPRGKIMIYRKFIDVHSQDHAEEFSISVNIMIAPESPEEKIAPQFIFDLDKGEIVSAITANSGREALCYLAQSVGDDRTAELLESLIDVHPDARVRWASIEALAALVPCEGEYVMNRAFNDRDLYVRQLARDRIRQREVVTH